jgi:hypothetical protein
MALSGLVYSRDGCQESREHPFVTGQLPETSATHWSYLRYQVD